MAHTKPKTSSKIKSFNSFDPNSGNTDIDLTKDNDGFKLVKNKNSKRNNRLKSSNYGSTIGRDESSSFKAYPKKFYVYLGKLDTTVGVSKVEEFLNKKLKNIKFEDSTRDVVFSNLKELNTDNKERSYNSFSFSVSYLNKDIINMKSLWPMYSIVGRHKLSAADWKIFSDKFKKPVASNSTKSTSVINGGQSS